MRIKEKALIAEIEKKERIRKAEQERKEALEQEEREIYMNEIRIAHERRLAEEEAQKLEAKRQKEEERNEDQILSQAPKRFTCNDNDDSSVSKVQMEALTIEDED